MDQNIQNVIWINNSRTAWPTKILMLFLVPWTIYYKIHTLFFKKVLIILRYSTKHANFWVGCAVPPYWHPLCTPHRKHYYCFAFVCLFVLLCFCLFVFCSFSFIDDNYTQNWELKSLSNDWAFRCWCSMMAHWIGDAFLVHLVQSYL